MNDAANPKAKTRIIKKRDPLTGDLIEVEVPIEPPQTKRRDADSGEVLQPGQTPAPAWTPPAPEPHKPPPPPTTPLNLKPIAAVAGVIVLIGGLAFGIPQYQEWRDARIAEAARIAELEAEQDAFREYFERTASAQYVGGDGNDTDLHRAALNGWTQLVQWLIDNGADVHARGSQGNTALTWAAMARKNAVSIVGMLLANGADVHVHSKYGTTPLHRAASRNRDGAAKLLLANGVDVNAKNYWGETPLHQAAQGNAVDTAKLLLANGADVNAKNNRSETPLDKAQGDSKMIALLKQHGGQ